jgi:hypothetical protein
VAGGATWFPAAHADTGMPTLGCQHWDAMAGWDAQLREHRPHGAAAVPRWLKGRRWVIGTRAVALGFAASVRSRLKDTGMSWLGHRHQSSGICRQPRRSAFGSRTLGCQGWDVQLREHRPHGAAAVPRWLKVCGLVSCVGWSQLWLGVKTTSRCQIHSLRVCVRHVRPALARFWRSSCAFLGSVRPMRVNPYASTYWEHWEHWEH